MSPFSPPSAAEWPAVLALLRASGLPTQDLTDSRRASFLIAHVGGAVAGCVAVEPYGEAGLLRSLAVAEGWQRRGLGVALVAAAEDAARAVGLRSLYLLTTTAAPFFERLGYTPRDRADVPGGVRRSSEFQGVCPASAACLGKMLRLGAVRARRTLSSR